MIFVVPAVAFADTDKPRLHPHDIEIERLSNDMKLYDRSEPSHDESSLLLPRFYAVYADELYKCIVEQIYLEHFDVAIALSHKFLDTIDVGPYAEKVLFWLASMYLAIGSDHQAQKFFDKLKYGAYRDDATQAVAMLAKKSVRAEPTF